MGWFGETARSQCSIQRSDGFFSDDIVFGSLVAPIDNFFFFLNASNAVAVDGPYCLAAGLCNARTCSQNACNYMIVKELRNCSPVNIIFQFNGFLEYVNTAYSSLKPRVTSEN